MDKIYGNKEIDFSHLIRVDFFIFLLTKLKFYIILNADSMKIESIKGKTGGRHEK